MKFQHVGKGALGMLVVAAALAGCAGPSGDQTSGTLQPAADALGGQSNADQMDALYQAAQKAGETTVVTYGPGEQLYASAYQVFMQRYPDIQVTGEYIFGAELSTRLDQEFASGKHVGSIQTAGAPATSATASKGECSAYTPFTADWLDKDLVAADGSYRAVLAYPVGIGYNTDKTSEDKLPATFLDLTDPKFAGQFVVSDPTAVGAATNAMASMLTDGLIDEQWIGELAANKPVLGSNGALSLQAVATGQVSFDAFAQYTQYKQAIEDGLPVGFYFPLQDSRVEYHYSCVYQDAPNQDATDLLYNWLFTPEGQDALATAGVFGIRPGSTPPEGLPTFQDAIKDQIPWQPVPEVGDSVKQFLAVSKKAFL